MGRPDAPGDLGPAAGQTTDADRTDVGELLHLEAGVMVSEDLPTDPEWAELIRITRELVDQRQAQATPTDNSTGVGDAQAAADDPFDRLRAELRRLGSEQKKGWR